jgi:hypothetical protein
MMCVTTVRTHSCAVVLVAEIVRNMLHYCDELLMRHHSQSTLQQNSYVAGKVLLLVWSELNNVWGVVATTDQRLLFVECRPGIDILCKLLLFMDGRAGQQHHHHRRSARLKSQP